MKTLGTILVIVLLMFAASRASAMTHELTFEWNANTESDLAGYRIFGRLEGAAYDYTAPLWDGQETTYIITQEGELWFFVARAYDESGNESEDSNEVRFDKEPPAPPQNFLIKLWKIIVAWFRAAFGSLRFA